MPTPSANITSSLSVMETALDWDSNGHMPLQGAQKDVHEPKHLAWQRTVTRPGMALRWQNFRLAFSFKFKPLQG
eukprot:5531847-Amphidinium_carterae.1